MNSPGLFLCLIVFNIALASCSSNPATQRTIIVNADSFMNDGVKAFAQADWDRAKWLFNKALALHQGVDDQKGVLFSHINLAEVALSTKEYQTAQTHLDLAVVITQTASLQPYQRRITLLSAQSAIKQQNYVQAEKVLQSLLPEFKELTPDNPPDIIQLTAIANRTKIAFLQKQDESIWTQRYANAMALSANKSPELENRLLRFQADLLQRQQHYQEAESLLQTSLSGYKTTLSRSGIAATLAELGQLSLSQDRWQDAKNYFMRSNQVFHYVRDLDKFIQNTKQLIKIEAALGNLERSNTLIESVANMQSKDLNRTTKKQINHTNGRESR